MATSRQGSGLIGFLAACPRLTLSDLGRSPRDGKLFGIETRCVGSDDHAATSVLDETLKEC